MRVAKYRKALQKHLRHLPNTLRALTGLSGHVWWARTGPHPWNPRDLPIRFPLCRGVIAENPETLNRCRQCALRQLHVTMQSGPKGHRFTCHHGVHNYWLSLSVRHRLLGVALVQALDSRTRQRHGPGSSNAVRQPAPGALCRYPVQPSRRPAPRMSRSAFQRSSKLLHFAFQHAETLILADSRQADLRRTQQALRELQVVTQHQRENLNGLNPAVHRTVPVLQLRIP